LTYPRAAAQPFQGCFQAMRQKPEVELPMICLAARPVACYINRNFIMGNSFDAMDWIKNVMEYSQLGAVIALMGLVLLLFTNLNRRAARRRHIWTPTDVFIQKWGSLAAYALIAVGLLFLLRR
jgi:hypothetical protein